MGHGWGALPWRWRRPACRCSRASVRSLGKLCALRSLLPSRCSDARIYSPLDDAAPARSSPGSRPVSRLASPHESSVLSIECRRSQGFPHPPESLPPTIWLGREKRARPPLGHAPLDRNYGRSLRGGGDLEHIRRVSRATRTKIVLTDFLQPGDGMFCRRFPLF